MRSCFVVVEGGFEIVMVCGRFYVLCKSCDVMWWFVGGCGFV